MSDVREPQGQRWILKDPEGRRLMAELREEMRRCVFCTREESWTPPPGDGRPSRRHDRWFDCAVHSPHFKDILNRYAMWLPAEEDRP